MKSLRFLLMLVLLLQNQFGHAKAIENLSPNNLPAPAWIKAVDITNSKIHVKWAIVPGAVKYKVARFDVTNNVQLPDVFVLEDQYTSEPHNPGTTIEFEVSGVDVNEVVGDAITGEFTTTIIIVDDIANFTIPGTTQGNIPIFPNANELLGFTNSDYNSSTVEVQRYKVKLTDMGQDHYGEFLLWSQCSSAQESSARFRVWSKSAQVTTTSDVNDNHEATYIKFLINNQPFFTLRDAVFISGTPNTGSVTLKNDRSQVITFEKGNSTELNPCYRPHNGVIGSTYDPNEVTPDENIAEDRNEIKSTEAESALSVRPNPFSTSFTANYRLTEESPVSFTLFDYMGKSILTMDMGPLTAGSYSTGIQTNDLPSGIYMLVCQTNKGCMKTTLLKH